MSKQLALFWENFQNKNFDEAQKRLDTLGEKDKQAVLAELFQKSENHRKPFVVSILRGTIHTNKSFNDFYQAWHPDYSCERVKIHGQEFLQQSFPLPTRAINAVNVNNPNDIVSIGITWINNKEEEQMFWEQLKKMTQKEDAANELRHNRIVQVADRELLGLFRVETDDNLGTPF